MGTRTYDPAYIACSVLGIPITGFADGTFVKAERNEDAFKIAVGASGEVARARSRNMTGKVTFTIMASHPDNDLLSAASHLDELAGTGVGRVFIKDVNGTTLVLGANAWIVKPAAVEFGKEVTNREWVVECSYLYLNSGGENAVSAD